MAITTQATRARAFQPGMKDAVGTSLTTPSWDPATERRIYEWRTFARALRWIGGVAAVAGAVAVALRSRRGTRAR